MTTATATNPTLAEQLAAAAAASREPTLGELFLRGAGSVQGDIQSFLRQLATSPQAASEAEKERERREKRGLRKRKRQLMAASAAKTAAAASPPSRSQKNESGPSSSSSKKAKTTKNESDRPRQVKTAANLASSAAAPAPLQPRPPTAPAATPTYLPSAPTTPQPWPIGPPPPAPTTTRHRSLPLICADAQCDCSGVHDPAAVSTQSLWKSREFEHDGPYTTNNYHPVPRPAPSSSSSSFLVDSPISPLLPSASSSTSTLPPPAFLSTTTSTSMSLPPALSWVDSFFSSLGEMADLVEPSSGSIEMALPCTAATSTPSASLLSSAASLRHLYPAIDDWPSPHYPCHHQQQHDYTPQRSPITDLLYSPASSSALLQHAPTWQSESWSSPPAPAPAPPPGDQHTTAGCACCPAPAVAVGASSPYSPRLSWLGW